MGTYLRNQSFDFWTCTIAEASDIHMSVPFTGVLAYLLNLLASPEEGEGREGGRGSKGKMSIHHALLHTYNSQPFGCLSEMGLVSVKNFDTNRIVQLYT